MHPRFFVHIHRSREWAQLVECELRKSYWSREGMETRSRTVATAYLETNDMSEAEILAGALRELASAVLDELG